MISTRIAVASCIETTVHALDAQHLHLLAEETIYTQDCKKTGHLARLQAFQQTKCAECTADKEAGMAIYMLSLMQGLEGLRCTF